MAAVSDGDAPGRRQGGRKQKREHLEVAAAQQHRNADLRSKLSDSELAYALIDSWTRGLSSAAEIQRLAHKAHTDMSKVLTSLGKSTDFAPASLRALASFGDWGRYGGNIAAELKRWLGEPSLPAAAMFRIPMVVKKPRSGLPIFQNQDFPMMLPHTTFSHLFSHHRDKFNFKFIGIGPSDDKLHSFWSEVVARKDPRIIRHPMCTRPNWTRRAIPIALHGDAVPVFGVGRPTTKSLDCYSWQSLLAFGPTMSIKMLISCIFEHNKFKHADGTERSMDDIWKIICWSLGALFEGRYPTHDWLGALYEEGSSEALLATTPLTVDGYFCVLWSIKGDIDWFAKGLKLRHYSSNEPCDWCPANKLLDSSMWPTNFDVAAPWKTMLRSASDWRAYATTKHLLFEKLEYLSILNVEPDELHVLHLGVSQYFLGSILYILCFKLMAGPAAANLEVVWAALLVEYLKTPGVTQYTCISLSMFIDVKKLTTSYPRLKGRGSEVKNLVGPLLAVFKQYAPGWEHVAMAVLGLESLCTLNCILDDYKGDAFFPIDKAIHFRSAMDSFLHCYTYLGNAANAANMLCFSAVPKLHWAWHLAYRAFWLNPRRVACFLDEDFVKYMKQLAGRCGCSTQLHRVPLFMFQKYRYGAELDLHMPL